MTPSRLLLARLNAEGTLYGVQAEALEPDAAKYRDALVLWVDSVPVLGVGPSAYQFVFPTDVPGLLLVRLGAELAKEHRLEVEVCV